MIRFGFDEVGFDEGAHALIHVCEVKVFRVVVREGAGVDGDRLRHVTYWVMPDSADGKGFIIGKRDPGDLP